MTTKALSSAMHTCNSLLPRDNCRSFNKQKRHSQRTTKVRLIGGCSLRPAVSAMSSVPCLENFVKVGNNKISAKKQSGRRPTRRKQKENKFLTSTDVNGSSILPSSQASVSVACPSACMQSLQTDVSFTNVRNQTLPVLQSSVDNSNIMLDTVPLVSLSRMVEQPGSVAEGSSEVKKPRRARKRTADRRSASRAKLPQVKAVVRTAVQKRKGFSATAESAETTGVKRNYRRRTSTTRNDKFLESMTAFVSEVTKNMVSACIEQTFTQLIQKGLIVSPFAYSLSVDNSSLLGQHSSISSSNCDQTYSFQRHCVDSLVSADCPSLSTLLQSNDYSVGAVQQHASAPADFSASTLRLSPTFGFLGTHVEEIVASSGAAAVSHETPLLYTPVLYESVAYDNCSAAGSVSVGTNTGAYADVGGVARYSQHAQSKNLTDYSLTDLLNMSDGDIDALLSGFVDCFSDDQLSCDVVACSAASSDAFFRPMSLDASACDIDIPVCCSSRASVTEVFDCRRSMDQSNFYNIGEEAFQPDYYELDDDIDHESVAAMPDTVTTSADSAAAGKKIVIKKPSSADNLSMSPMTQRRRRWRSSSRTDTKASTPLTVSVETTVVVSSSVPSTQPVVSPAESEALSDNHGLALGENLEGDG